MLLTEDEGIAELEDNSSDEDISEELDVESFIINISWVLISLYIFFLNLALMMKKILLRMHLR